MKSRFFVLIALTLVLFSKNAQANNTAICLAGDVRLGITTDPFSDVKDAFGSCVVTFVNLETPLTNYARQTPGKSLASIIAHRNFVFRADPRLAADLKAGHVSAVSLANNHMLDYQIPAILDTLKALDGIGIKHAGGGKNIVEATKPAIVMAGKKKVGLLAYTYILPAFFAAGENRPGIAPAKGEGFNLVADIKAARKQVDILVVSFHWGIEVTNYPTAYQKQLAHEAIDAGADIIMGHHPHVTQGIEVYRGKPIFYSLGNFIFSSHSDICRSTIYARIDFDRDTGKLWSVTIFPFKISGYKPRYEKSGLSTTRVVNLSKPFGTRFTKAPDGIWTLSLDQ